MRFFRQIGELKGWKRFGFEVAIIVIGLSITLIAQELITSATRARATLQATNAVDAELMASYAYASERMAIEPCRREQIRDLAERLRNANGVWTADVPEGINLSSGEMVLPRVVRTPVRPWSDAAWQALLDSDAAIELDRQRFADLSIVYRSIQLFRDKQDEALRLGGELSHLAISGPLDAAQRRDAYAVLGRLAVIEGMMTIHAMQVREALQGIGFENERRFYRFEPGGDFDLAALIRSDIETYGACVDTTQYQPFIDELNATTGIGFAIPAATATP